MIGMMFLVKDRVKPAKDKKKENVELLVEAISEPFIRGEHRGAVYFVALLNDRTVKEYSIKDIIKYAEQQVPAANRGRG